MLTLVSVRLAAIVPSRAIVAADIASPIFGAAIPDGHRQWELVAPALVGETLERTPRRLCESRRNYCLPSGIAIFSRFSSLYAYPSANGGKDLVTL